MASGLPVIQPPETPSPPAIVETTAWDDNLDLDDGGFLSPNSATFRRGPPSPVATTSFLSPADGRGLLRPPSPSMASDDTSTSTDSSGAAAPAHNPFNFKTQIISTSPVKSVRAPLSLCSSHAYGPRYWD